MKKRRIAYGVLSLFFLCTLMFQLFRHHGVDIVTDHSLAESTQTEDIVAPAMIDSLRDITKVPVLQPGMVKRMDVRVGQRVKAGQVLFELESTLAENNAEIQKITCEQAKNSFLIQQKHLRHLKEQLSRLRSVDKRAISQAELQEKIHDVNMSLAQLKQAKNNLALAMVNLKNAELTLDQYRITAPKDAIVLQINAHLNEYVGGGQLMILLGDANKVIVRVSLDERDTQRFDPSAPAYIIGNAPRSLKIPLTFLQLDRYIVTQERLNSRVQEALYYFNRSDHPEIVAGQQFDANISVRTSA